MFVPFHSAWESAITLEKYKEQNNDETGKIKFWGGNNTVSIQISFMKFCLKLYWVALDMWENACDVIDIFGRCFKTWGCLAEALLVSHWFSCSAYPHSGSLLSHWSGQSSALTNLLQYLPQHFRARLTHQPDYGGSKLLWIVGQYAPDYTVQHPRRQFSS
jgi:hypothetical protein